jgi:hypothetical protein
VPPSTAGELTTFAELVANEVNPDRGALLLTELRTRVQGANDAARRLRAHAEEAEVLLASLSGLEGPRVEEVSRLLDQVTRHEAPLTEELKRRTLEVRAHARRDEDRRYAADVIRRAFVDLGYEVGEEFETLFADRGAVYCERPEWRGYSVCVRASQDRGQLDFSVVRFAGGAERPAPENRVRDREIEEAWCADYDRLAHAMRQGGIRLDTVRRVPPGATAVPVVLRGEASRGRTQSRESSRRARE